MRSSKSRSRSKQNRNRSVGNVLNRVFDSSGPEGKVRGTPQQIIEKYNQLGRDAQLSNDRVAAENFQQHAEHYQRMLGEATREQEARREVAERENKERQAERDRDRSERQSVAQVTAEPDDSFVSDLSQSDQPEVQSMPITDHGLGLVDTPETKTLAIEAGQSDKSKSSTKPQAKRRRKQVKITEGDASSEDANSGSSGDASTSEKPSQAIA